MENSTKTAAALPKGNGVKLKIAKVLLACVLIVAVSGVLGCCCASNTSNSGTSSTSPYGSGTATPRATPTPKALSGADLYSTWDKEKIKSEAQKVDWEDFVRNTDSYEGKLIMLHGDVVTATKVGNDYTYDVNINPNLMSDHDWTSNSAGDNYNPQFITFDYGSKFIEGDIIDLYGVYEGNSELLTQYPEIEGVYVVYYTSK